MAFRTTWLVFAFCSFISKTVVAQDTTMGTSPVVHRDTVWHQDLAVSLNLSQVSFTHWQAGGVNSLAYTGSVVGRSMRDDSSTNWSTTSR